MRTKLVFNPIYSKILQDKGYEVVTTLPNKHNEKLEVSVFMVIDGFLDDLNELIKK